MADSDSPGPIQELTTSRARFVAELGERLAALRQGLSRMASTAEAGAELNAVRRRLHALAAAADVLRFASTADALAMAEAALASTGPGAPSSPARERVGRILDLVPSLVLGAAIDVGSELEAEHADALREPLCIVIAGDAALEALLHKAGPLHAPETHCTQDPERVLELVARLSPDVLVLDGDRPEAAELVPRLRQASSARIALVAVGSFDRHEPMQRLIRRGVSRILPRPVDAGSLQRTVRQCCVVRRSPPVEPSQFRRLSAAELVTAIGVEARKAFGDAESGDKLAGTLELGSGTEVLAALWAAFARIRALAMLGSDGAVRFRASGPGGTIPLAPLAASSGRRVASETASVAGRTIVVAAADGAVCGLLARSLEGLGAVVLTAPSGRRALELVEEHWPDALVADALLPDLSGFELCRRLRLDMALADTPVALVLWKDELLDRARHVEATLASAAGAIEPSSVASELEEALGARANLERRFARHARVGGRLDGITPRLILELACARAPSSLLTVQCGSVRFEVVLSDGRIARASATDAHGVPAEGPRVLPAFFGSRRGRFTLEPLDEAPAATAWAGDLKALCAPIVRRARRAREVIESAELDSVQRVVLDPLATAVYLDDSGGTERSLVARLQSGSSPSTLKNASSWDDTTPAPLAATLRELASRGAIDALLDTRGRDLLDTSGSGAAPFDSGATSAPNGAALLELGEVVRQAVSRTPAPPPTAPPESAPAIEASAAAVDVPPRDPEPAAAPDNAPTPAAHASISREPPPDTELEGAELADLQEDSSAEGPDDVWPPSAGTKVRAALVPLLITLSAAAAAFVAVRALGEGGWQTLRAALRSSSAEAAVADAGAQDHPREIAPQAAAALPAAASEDDLATERGKVPIDVVFESELLEVPLQARLRPGQGLLEVSTWERQQIYVDGVFMGNYESRLIPLVPGTYQVRLRDGGRHIERSVEVRAGQRTRLSARPKSAKPR